MFFKEYLKEILLGIIIILIIGIYSFGWYIYFYQDDSSENILLNIPIEENEEEANKQTSKTKYVEVKGAVATPGVYPITDETIVNDIITLAGGFKENAYTNNINLSKKLEDETVIYVYTKYEYSQLNKKEEPIVIIEECNCPEIDMSACLDSGSSIITSDENKESITEEKEESNPNEDSSLLETLLININTASKEELMTLNGIGDAKAQKIIDYRNENGSFKTIEDIKLVSGISDNLFEKIKDNITI